MPINMKSPISWTTTDEDELLMLQSLQRNILKGHGRHFVANLFFKLKNGSARKSRRMLRDLANFHVTSAYRQLVDADRFKRAGKKSTGGKGAGGFVHVALSAHGYTMIERGGVVFSDEEFKRGMKHPDSIAALDDPAVSAWEPCFRDTIDGLVIVAHEKPNEMGALAGQIRELIEDADGTVFVQHGAALFNAAGEGIEHFGYVDGRSQPLLVKEDIDEEREKTGTNRWDPQFGIGLALVPDPGVTDDGKATAFGSFLVFRKLEQHVRAFKTRELEIATKLGLKDEERELAGALVVGRFEDGTPVTLSDKARALSPPNNFDYTNDDGIRCPFHAHIRKTNPRGSGTDGSPASELAEREHLMPRRGITYEDTRREVPPAELPDATTMKDFRDKVSPKLPVGGVGLLFAVYNADIARQFRFTQESWANATNFPIKPGAPHGIDPVIGQDGKTDQQHKASKEQKLPKEWDEPSKGTENEVGFAGFVTMKGGEYFFSPSLTFLLNL